MWIYLIAAFVVVFAVLTWLYIILPSKRDTGFTPGELIAHRGYHSIVNGVPENSIKAFEEAIRRGYAIELDVRLTADKQVVVFHDASLTRMCGGENANVSDYTYEKLLEFNLSDSDQKIPLMSEVLSLVNGQVPLLIEVKNSNDDIDDLLCENLAQMLDSYEGAFAVQSFSPNIVAWFNKNRSTFIRGLLMKDYSKANVSIVKKAAWALGYYHHMSRPDFFAVYHDDKIFVVSLLKKFFGAKVFGWTAVGWDNVEQYRGKFDNLIFELKAHEYNVEK